MMGVSRVPVGAQGSTAKRISDTAAFATALEIRSGRLGFRTAPVRLGST